MWLDGGHGGYGGTTGRPFMLAKSERQRSSKIKWFKGLGFETSNTTIAAHASTTVPTTGSGLEFDQNQTKQGLEGGRTGQQ